jgi:hypothetical protein
MLASNPFSVSDQDAHSRGHFETSATSNVMYRLGIPGLAVFDARTRSVAQVLGYLLAKTNGSSMFKTLSTSWTTFAPCSTARRKPEVVADFYPLKRPSNTCSMSMEERL